MQRRMKNKVGIGLITYISCFLILLGSGCTEDQLFLGNSQVDANFQLKGNSALKGKVTIDQAYLKLDRIQVNGNYGGKILANVTHPVPAEEAPYLLSESDTSHVSFRLPTSPYDQLDFNFFLFQDNYQLVFHQTPMPETPTPPAGDNGGTTDPGNGNDGQDDGGGNDDPSDGADEGEGDGNGSGGDDGGADDDGDGDDGDNDNGDDDEGDTDGDSDDNGGGKKDKKKNKDDNKDKGKGNDDDDDDDDDRTFGNTAVDLDHFFQNAKPSLVVFGTLNNNGVTTKLIFVVTNHEKFSLRATQNDNHNIVLTEKHSATISFDPEQWFSAISTSDIESASKQIYQGQAVVFIHRDFNSNLHAALLSKLEASAQMTFSAPVIP